MHGPSVNTSPNLPRLLGAIPCHSPTSRSSLLPSLTQLPFSTSSHNPSPITHHSSPITHIQTVWIPSFYASTSTSFPRNTQTPSLTSRLPKGIRELRRPKPVNLDFDARVPIPISVFPSTYRSDATSAETTDTKVEGEVNLGRTSRVGREDTRFSKEEIDVNFDSRRNRREGDVRIYEEGDRDRYPEVELTREKYRGPAEFKENFDVVADRRETRDSIDVENDRRQNRDQTFDTQIDVTERDYRRRTQPNYDVEYERRRPTAEVEVEKTEITIDRPKKDMGYYDDQGEYHSFRRGVERAAERIMHPFHHNDREEVIVEDEGRGPSRSRGGNTESIRYVEPRGGISGNTVTIPCHFIRMGDLVILQGRPCQIIRISTSSQTGQYRYLGVDLFTRQLQEESSFQSNPEPSVYVQSMRGPVFKQYRILDIRDDGRVVCMTETGDVKQGLPVIDQNNLFSKISGAFQDGRGSVRALVINDGGRELIVDYKVIHGSRL